MTSPSYKIAHHILAQAGQPDPQPPPLDQLAELAREYLRLAPGARETLSDVPALFVSLGAAREFGAAMRHANDETARRRLTELLVDAKQSATDPAEWRYRNRATAIDITAHVAVEGRLLVVTHVHVRPYSPGRGRQT